MNIHHPGVSGELKRRAIHAVGVGEWPQWKKGTTTVILTKFRAPSKSFFPPRFSNPCSSCVSKGRPLGSRESVPVASLVSQKYSLADDNSSDSGGEGDTWRLITHQILGGEGDTWRLVREVS